MNGYVLMFTIVWFVVVDIKRKVIKIVEFSHSHVKCNESTICVIDLLLIYMTENISHVNQMNKSIYLLTIYLSKR